ncbi:MAG: hypothetical protein OSJ74_00075 [Clostridia bacterium]|nr:hypothetical protein [Clostridia bacterium]
MADNRIAYGIANGMGIDTDGMEPKAVWQAIADKQGVSVEQAMRHAYAQKIKDSLNKRIAKASEELKKQSQMTAEEKIASVHIDFDKDNILPELNEDTLEKIGMTESKSVLLKSSIIKRNLKRHIDVSDEIMQNIITEALYRPIDVFPANPNNPNYYHLASFIEVRENDGLKMGLVLLDIDASKKNFEIGHAYFVGSDGYERAKDKIKKD